MIRVHVNRSHIAMNAKDGGDRPVYTIKRDGETRYARRVIFDGPVEAVYDPKGLPCGAKAWLETSGPITLVGECSFQEARNGALSG